MLLDYYSGVQQKLSPRQNHPIGEWLELQGSVHTVDGLGSLAMHMITGFSAPEQMFLPQLHKPGKPG